VKGSFSHSSNGGGNQDIFDGCTSNESIVWNEGHVTRNGDAGISSTRSAVSARIIVDGWDVNLISYMLNFKDIIYN